MANNPSSFRLPVRLPADIHPALREALSNHDDAITDLQQAIPYLKNSITSKSSTTSTGVTSGGGTETVVVANTTISNAGSVNNQSGVTSYTTQQSDFGALIVFNDAAAVSVTLATKGTSPGLQLPWYTGIFNLGAGTVTLTPASGTISYASTVGASSMPIASGQWAFLYFDGVNFWADLYAPSGGGGGTITGVTAGTGLSGGGTTGIVPLALQTPVTVADGGTGTATPSLVAGSGIAISGSFPNQTVAATGGGSGGYLKGTVTINLSSTSGTFYGTTTITGANIGNGATMFCPEQGIAQGGSIIGPSHRRQTMDYDPLSLRPDQRLYTLAEVCAILKRAEDMGLPMDAGSWIEELTLGQIDLLTKGVHDA
ncbi:unnamed protein product [Sphagnum jensenii]